MKCYKTMKHIKFVVLACSFTILGFSQTKRPQEPKAPFDYPSELVFFENPKAENIKLAGTLTLPKDVKKPPVAILISGSGPQNRDEELMGHKPFLVLADYLTRNGIAVLRYDDRGTAESTGDFNIATTFDFASDAEAAMRYLKTRKDINPNKIGLIGHSEGGLIAALVAAQYKNVAFIIMLAGTGVNGRAVLESQSWEIAKQMGASEETLKFNKAFTSTAYDVLMTEKNENKNEIEPKIKTALKNFKTDLETKNSPYAMYVSDALIERLVNQITSPWFINFIKIEPKDYLEKTTCPVLALNGSKDLQVLAKLNLEAIESALITAGNKDITLKELEGLNHLFQTANTGSPSEYSVIEETFSPIALKIIKDWILNRF